MGRAWLREEAPRAVAVHTGALAANDAANYLCSPAAISCWVNIQGCNKPAYVRVNAYKGTVDVGEASGTNYDFLVPTTASKDPDTRTVDVSQGGRIMVKSVSIFFLTDTTGMDTAGNVVVRQIP